ncbi:MAG: PASTA domain-containing protein [Bacteroidales bacterium]|nr:PASTA domain-containing protein [Bacteroidales bacterium]
MEVATGAIRAMVSLSKDANGNFSESFDSYNYAIGYLGEPGSVFKLATLVTALEDKKVTLETEQRADVIWQFNKTKFEDTYLRNYSTITVAKGLEISSNNVFRRIAGEYYRHNPQEFVDKLNNERKISYNFDFDIPGLAKARINSPKDKHWSLTDLPQIGMGYAVKLTPLHILSFYNAIANNGVMVKPHIVENWQRNGVIEKEFPVETIGRVCSEKTAETARTALRGVVIGSNGTARNAFKNCKIDVAGKTGTARVALSHGYVDSKGHKRHQGSFVGFFPYENPKYSVIVVVHSCLSFKNFYGGTWGGPVAREIAETIYASSPEWGEHLSSGKSLPAVASSPEWGEHLNSGKSLPAVAEYKAFSANDTIEGIPSVIGMGLREATYYLESRGYTVSSEGSGKVKSQSPAPGDTIANGDRKINILLSDNYEIK